jgi:hypothetical protein
LLLPLTAFTLLPSTIIAMGTSASVRFAMNPPALLARDPEYVCVQRAYSTSKPFLQRAQGGHHSVRMIVAVQELVR